MCAAIIGVLAVAGCAHRKGSGALEQSKQIPAFAVLAPNAFGVATTTSGGGAHVEYLVTEPFPATVTRASITEELRRRGWRPRETDFGGGSGGDFDQGEISLGEGPAYLRGWVGYWQDQKGNVVSYGLLYHPEAQAADGGAVLRVVVTLVKHDDVNGLERLYRDRLLPFE